MTFVQKARKRSSMVAAGYRVPRPGERGGAAAGRAYCGRQEATQASTGATMSDKSPRQSMTKKTSKSIKEKRADKRAKGHEETFSEKLTPKKKSGA